MSIPVIPGLDPGSPDAVCYRAFFRYVGYFLFLITNCVIAYYENGGIDIWKKFSSAWKKVCERFGV
jgi:hypothetical protein